MKKKNKKTTKNISKKKVSTKGPHVEIIGAEVDSRKGIKIELNWNDEFVEYLKKNGYTGTSEEAIVQKWLGQLYGQLAVDINPDKKSDFEN
jgi:hypothetical protein